MTLQILRRNWIEESAEYHRASDWRCASQIDGKIESTFPGFNEATNLYFINPAGVVFGPNAVHLGGSLRVTTTTKSWLMVENSMAV